MAKRIRFKGKQPKDFPSLMKRAAGIALYEVVPVLDRQFTVEIQTVQWQWPRKTKRENGQTVSSPRDIVDTGDLMRSQQNQKIDNFTWRWTWDVEYSKIVHNGAVLKQGGNYPARPWTKTAERVVKPRDLLDDIIRRELNG
tara:strand:+ start:414 stop:836 length:423 start_codon:yes stop_codon:yes gene_type:complete